MKSKIFSNLFLLLLVSCSKTKNGQDNLKSKSILPNYKSEIELDLSKGRQIYLLRCATCHQNEGQGVKGVYPPLSNSDWFKKDVKTQAISSVKNGKKGLITVNGVNYDGVMPALQLSDLEISQVLTYIYRVLNNSQTTVTEAEVRAVKAKTFSGK